MAENGSPRALAGFRRFLGGDAKSTDDLEAKLAALAELGETVTTPPTTPPRPKAPLTTATRHGGTPTREPRSKQPADLAQSAKKTVKGSTAFREPTEPGSFRRGGSRRPSYVWLSKKTREARSTAVDIYSIKF